MQNMLEKIEILTIDVYCSLQCHGINQIYRVSLKLDNQQTMIIGLNFVLLLSIEICNFFKISSWSRNST